MRKVCIMSFITLLIFASCDSQTSDDEYLNSVPTTRSSIDTETFGLYNTVFKNIISYDTDSGFGNYCMSGDIETFPQGVEYDFILATQIKGNMNCVVWANGGHLIYNGKHKPSIWGVSGREIKFTIRFYSSKTTVKLAVERDVRASQEGFARLVLAGVRYNGETIYPSLQGDFDLNVAAVYRDLNDGHDNISDPYHWKCNNCNFLNGGASITCISCRDGGKFN